MENFDEIQDLKEGGNIDALLELDEEVIDPVDGIEAPEIALLDSDETEDVSDEEDEDEERDDDILMESFEDIDNF